MLFSIALGIGLAAATGFRVFVPLLVAGLAARIGVIPLADSFQWLQSTPALIALGTAATLETHDPSSSRSGIGRPSKPRSGMPRRNRSARTYRSEGSWRRTLGSSGCGLDRRAVHPDGSHRSWTFDHRNDEELATEGSTGATERIARQRRRPLDPRDAAPVLPCAACRHRGRVPRTPLPTCPGPSANASDAVRACFGAGCSWSSAWSTR